MWGIGRFVLMAVIRCALPTTQIDVLRVIEGLQPGLDPLPVLA
jgi:hypothetical protein